MCIERLAKVEANTGSEVRAVIGDVEQVEVDKTFVGGKATNVHKSVRERKGMSKGGGSIDKTLVLGVRERNARQGPRARPCVFLIAGLEPTIRTYELTGTTERHSHAQDRGRGRTDHCARSVLGGVGRQDWHGRCRRS